MGAEPTYDIRVKKPYVVRHECLTLQEVERTYTLVEPHHHGPNPPLIIVFHGSEQSSRVFRKFTGGIFDDAAAATGAILAYPDGYHQHFNDARICICSSFETRKRGIDDVAFTAAIIHRTVQTHGVDPSRVFVVGYSNGGQMVIRLIHEAPKLLAGAATIAATQPSPRNFLLADRLPTKPKPVRLLAIHGTADPLAPYEGGEASLWGHESRGCVLSAPDSAAYFARRNCITATPTRDRPMDDVEVTRWREPGREPVELWTVEGMGHVVPSPRKLSPRLGPGTDSFVAAEVIAEFFGLEAAPAEG